MIRLRKNGVSWELEPGFQPLLDEIVSPQSQTAVIKESPVKLVTLHSARGLKFYVKRYQHFAVALRPLKFFFKPSQARQEWQLAQQIESLGVPIVRHVALGERWTSRGLQESILITESFDGMTLSEKTNFDSKAVLDFINRMHERGVLQTDLHPGNILVAASGEMRLVDLHGTKIMSQLNEYQRMRNLARLRSALEIPVSSEVERMSIRERQQRMHYRSGRCLKHNREFAPKKLGGLEWRVRLPFFNETVQSILSDPENFLKSRAKILKAGRTATVGCAEGFVLKRFNFRKAENLVKDWFRHSRAYRAYCKAYHLELLGIPTAKPIAAAEQRVFSFLRRSYLLMEEIPGATSLGQKLRSGKKPSREIIRKTAELIGRLHQEGFSHRDLKESNIVFDRDGKIFLLDLDGLNFPGSVSSARAAVDLERLARDMSKCGGVTRIEREIFLRDYCRARKLKKVPRLS